MGYDRCLQGPRYPKVREDRGRFTRGDLKDIWADEYADKGDELLQLMMSFKLCYEIPGQQSTYIAPHLLSADRPGYTWDDAQSLHLRYEYEFMPKGVKILQKRPGWIALSPLKAQPEPVNLSELKSEILKRWPK